MKILIFTGGLGNQIFEYAFYRYLADNNKGENIYGIYDKRWLSEHNGLEIEKWTAASLPPSRWYAKAIVFLAFALRRLFGYNKLIANDDCVISEKKIIYWAFHFDKRYVRYCDVDFNIDRNLISKKNTELVNEIESCNSVFIHVRRGDYLSKEYRHLFEGTCTLDYYKRAINYIKLKIDNPHFYIFSDDKEWVKANLELINATYIDWNLKENSPLDMWLMSRCKVGIIANSTFSYWGAILGAKKTIVCPKKWYADTIKDPDWQVDLWIPI